MKSIKLLRQTTALLLTLSLLLLSLSALSATAAESEKATEETEFSLKLSIGEPLPRYSLADGTVELINGTAVRWIDRVVLSDEMLALYDTLVEGTDNDGYQDVLIEDSYLTDDPMIEIKTTSVSLTGTDQEAEISAAAKDLLNRYADPIYAVLAAFDRDHPEVFWLNGNYVISCVPSVSGSTCSLKLVLKLKDGTQTIRTDTYTSESQIKDAILQRDEAIKNILSELSLTDSAYEKLAFFNDVLTMTNEYNTSYNLNTIDPDCRECIAALDGRTGRNGPICESYARAFKVLCDASDIPCVLVDGIATNSSGQGEGHMWNYVQVGSFWYAVDVTWNDPSNYWSSGAVSGLESRDWFLVGSDTRISGRAFLSSHPVENQVYEGGLKFTNGPTLSTDAYTDSISVVPVLSGESPIYDGTPQTPEVIVKNGSNTLSETLYTVSYANNIKPGSATVTVTVSSGEHTGTYTATFSIRPKPLEILPEAPTKVYDGTTDVALTPKYDTTQIVEGDVFDVTLRGEFQSPNVGKNIPLSVHVEEKGEDMRYYDLILPDRLFGEITQATLPALSEKASNTTFSQKGFTQPTFLGVDGTALVGSYSYYFGEWGPFTYEQLSAKLSACLSDDLTDDPMILAMKGTLLSDGSLSIRCSFFDCEGNYGEHSTLLTFTPAEKKEETPMTADLSEETSDTANKTNGGSSSGNNRGTTSQSGDTILKLILLCALGGVALIPTGLVTFVIIFFAVRGHKKRKAKKQANRQNEDQTL